jgi:5-enolpyruvylshikimate-3-phosphate synthase
MKSKQKGLLADIGAAGYVLRPWFGIACTAVHFYVTLSGPSEIHCTRKMLANGVIAVVQALLRR